MAGGDRRAVEGVAGRDRHRARDGRRRPAIRTRRRSAAQRASQRLVEEQRVAVAQQVEEVQPRRHLAHHRLDVAHAAKAPHQLLERQRSVAVDGEHLALEDRRVGRRVAPHRVGDVGQAGGDLLQAAREDAHAVAAACGSARARRRASTPAPAGRRAPPTPRRRRRADWASIGLSGWKRRASAAASRRGIAGGQRGDAADVAQRLLGAADRRRRHAGEHGGGIEHDALLHAVAHLADDDLGQVLRLHRRRAPQQVGEQRDAPAPRARATGARRWRRTRRSTSASVSGAPAGAAASPPPPARRSPPRPPTAVSPGVPPAACNAPPHRARRRATAAGPAALGEGAPEQQAGGDLDRVRRQAAQVVGDQAGALAARRGRRQLLARAAAKRRIAPSPDFRYRSSPRGRRERVSDQAPERAVRLPRRLHRRARLRADAGGDRRALQSELARHRAQAPHQPRGRRASSAAPGITAAPSSWCRSNKRQRRGRAAAARPRRRRAADRGARECRSHHRPRGVHPPAEHLRAARRRQLDGAATASSTATTSSSRSGPSADNGETVVAVVNGEATVKRFYREKTRQDPPAARQRRHAADRRAREGLRDARRRRGGAAQVLRRASPRTVAEAAEALTDACLRGSVPRGEPSLDSTRSARVA